MKNKQIKRAIDTNLLTLRITECDVQNIMMQAKAGRKAKKKISVVFAIALLVILLTATAVGVGILNGLHYWKAADEEVGAPLHMVMLNDEVYFITEAAFYQWTQNGVVLIADREALQKMDIETLNSWLFVHNEAVMLLTKQGKLWRFCAGEWSLERDYAGTQLPEAFRRVRKLVCQDGYVFVEASSDGASHALLRFDLSDGTVCEMPFTNVMRIYGYRDKKILAVIKLSEEEEQLVMVDAASGRIVSELITMHALAMSGLAYDAKHDCIYGMVNGRLSVWDGMQWQEIRKVTLPAGSHSFAVTNDHYLAASYDGIQSIVLNGNVKISQTELTIRGVNSFVSGLDHDFQQMHPNLTVARQAEGYFAASDVMRAMEAGDQTDLFYITVDASWLSLLESGKLCSVSSGELNAAVSEMADVFRNVLIKNGKLYAVPAAVTIEVWEKLRSDVPVTYAELFAKPYDGLTWTGVRWSQKDYVTHLLKQQILESDAGFDTLAFRQTLEMMKSNGLSKRSQTVMNTSYGFAFGNLRVNQERIAPLKIDPMAETLYPVTLHCYVLNPNGQNQQAALAYLEYAFEKADASTRAILDPEHVEPTLLPAAELWIENVKMQHAQDVKDGLLPDDPAALEERIEIIRNMPGHQLVTQEQIEQYKKEIEPYLALKLEPLLSYEKKAVIAQMAETIECYLDGKLEIDETILQLNGMT